MKPLSFFLCAIPACAAQLMTGGAGSNGVWVDYVTRLEPATPGISRHGGGVLTEKNIIKRHLCNFDNKTYFGYDLTLENLGGRYKFHFAPLSITPKEMSQIFDQVSDWKALPLPGGPISMDVRPGDTVALDLFINRSTGQRVTDYLKVAATERQQITVAGPARDFTPADAVIEISAPLVTVDGKSVADWAGAISGHAVWVDLPGHGRFVFSLAPRPDLGMQRAGEIRGTSIKWRMASHDFAIATNKPVTSGAAAYHLYVANVPRTVEHFGMSAGPKPDDAIRRH